MAGEPQPHDGPQPDERCHVEFIGRGLADHEAREEDAEGDRQRGEHADAGAMRHRDTRMHAPVMGSVAMGGGHAQYAFSVLRSRIGVRNSIFRSSSSDQFSM